MKIEIPDGALRRLDRMRRFRHEPLCPEVRVMVDAFDAFVSTFGVAAEPETSALCWWCGVIPVSLSAIDRGERYCSATCGELGNRAALGAPLAVVAPAAARMDPERFITGFTPPECTEELEAERAKNRKLTEELKEARGFVDMGAHKPVHSAPLGQSEQAHTLETVDDLLRTPTEGQDLRKSFFIPG